MAHDHVLSPGVADGSVGAGPKVGGGSTAAAASANNVFGYHVNTSAGKIVLRIASMI